MLIAILCLLALLATGLLMVFGAVVELNRQVIQLRLHTGLVDRSIALELAARPMPAELVRVVQCQAGGKDDAPRSNRHIALFLSDSCTTCITIARELTTRSYSDTVSVLLEARTATDAATWAGEFLPHTQVACHYDVDGQIAADLGVRVTPALVKIEDGVVIAAMTVPSIRVLDRAVEWTYYRETDSKGASRWHAVKSSHLA